MKDIIWLKPAGLEMTDAEWNSDQVRCLGVRLEGDAMSGLDEFGTPLVADTLLYLMNAAADPIRLTLPAFASDSRWKVIVDTFDERRIGQISVGGAEYDLAEHSLALFRFRRPREDRQP